MITQFLDLLNYVTMSFMDYDESLINSWIPSSLSSSDDASSNAGSWAIQPKGRCFFLVRSWTILIFCHS